MVRVPTEKLETFYTLYDDYMENGRHLARYRFYKFVEKIIEEKMPKLLDLPHHVSFDMENPCRTIIILKRK